MGGLRRRSSAWGRSPPPRLPPKLKAPRLKPLSVMPHCALPSAFFHALVTALQSWPSMALNRFVGSRRLTNDVEADAFQNVVETGERLDGLGRCNVLVVGRDPRRCGAGGLLIERAARAAEPDGPPVCARGGGGKGNRNGWR